MRARVPGASLIRDRGRKDNQSNSRRRHLASITAAIWRHLVRGHAARWRESIRLLYLSPPPAPHPPAPPSRPRPFQPLIDPHVRHLAPPGQRSLATRDQPSQHALSIPSFNANACLPGSGLDAHFRVNSRVIFCVRSLLEFKRADENEFWREKRPLNV